MCIRDSAKRIPNLVSHPGRHFTQTRQPLLSTHLLFKISNLCQIFEHTNQACLLPLFMQWRKGHSENQAVTISTLTFYFESRRCWHCPIELFVCGFARMPVENFAPGTPGHISNRIPSRFLRRWVE